MSDPLVVKVKNPWAWLLFATSRSRKNFENRSWKLPGGAGWVVVCSSKAKPKKADIAEARRRITLLGDNPDTYNWEGMKGHCGVVLGMVYVKECVKSTDGQPLGIWHNPPDYGWSISEFLLLPRPFRLDETDKFQTCVRLSKRPRYAAAIRAQLEESTVTYVGL